MVFPHCGGYQVRTVDSRPYDTQVRRRRECADCLERFNTIEIPLEEHKALKQKEYTLRNLKGDIIAMLNRLIK